MGIFKVYIKRNIVVYPFPPSIPYEESRNDFDRVRKSVRTEHVLKLMKVGELE